MQSVVLTGVEQSDKHNVKMMQYEEDLINPCWFEDGGKKHLAKVYV